jgi:hypothetical protein
LCGSTAIPPGIICPAKSGDIRDNWIHHIPDDCYVAATPSWWSDKDHGLAWLKDVFSRYTKPKARRLWRLLILDGHGSHVTIPFMGYAIKNRILLTALPPHSTHTLQPLDVGMFGPLSKAYSAELLQQQLDSQGLLPVKKSDLLPLFAPAYNQSFTEKNTIAS